MNTRKLPSGRWQSKVYIGTADGKKKFRSITAATKKECIIKAAAVLDEAKAKKQSAASGVTVAQAVKRYIASKRGVISPATVRNYMNMLSKNIEPEPIGAVLISALTVEKVQAWVSSLSQSGLSKKTIRNNYALFAPAIAMFGGGPFNVEFPKGKAYKGYVPSTEEVQRIMAVAAAKRPELYKACLLAACSTLRRGEISCLTADNIRGNILHVENDMVRDEDRNWIVKKLPKEEASVRDIPLPQSVINKLPKEGRLVNLNPDQITGQFERNLKNAGVPAFRFHDLRKYSVSLMITEGVSLTSVKELGGWSNIQTPQNIYLRTIEDAHQREMAQFLGKLETLNF